MLIIFACFLIIFVLALYVFYRYLLKNNALLFLAAEDRSLEKYLYVIKAIIFSLFYSENQVQKKIISCFRKLGKIKIIGKDGWGNITLRFSFPNKEVCHFLIPLVDNWRMIQGGKIMTKYFMESFNVGWYGYVNDLEKAAKRGTVGNFLLNL